MTGSRIYLSTTIPYVNSRPHLGFALELVQADVLARHYRRTGEIVRLQSGTDDNSLKNVLAARAAGLSTGELVRRNAAAFAALRDQLSLSFDDFIRTGSDPRHRPGVHRLWRACEASGDLYRRQYRGLYCVGCEQFYTQDELAGGRCPEHGTEPQLVEEENWFFRLSRYADQLHELISSGRLRIEPASRRNEVLSFIAGGLDDFSVSRSTARARGWGIGVPGDPGQVIYVWWDALGNYITAPGYGTDQAGYRRWWTGADRRIHLVGKGVLRFHAVYWPAILLSAGQPLPTQILVHDYLTAGGRRISKSAGPAPDPAALAGRYGVDAVRWWLLREVPRTGDTDFTEERLVARANGDLANSLGNLASRVLTLAQSSRAGRVSPLPRPAGSTRWLSAAGQHDTAHGGHWPADAASLQAAIQDAPKRVAAALEDFDFRAATAGVWAIFEEANRYINATKPWQLAKAEQRSHAGATPLDRPEAGDQAAGRRLDVVLGALLTACQSLAAELAPFLPDLAGQLAAACDDSAGRLGEPRPLFPRIETGTVVAAGAR